MILGSLPSPSRFFNRKQRKCWVDNVENLTSFVQLGFNLSDGATDTLESSSKLLYLIQVKIIYTAEYIDSNKGFNKMKYNRGHYG